MNAGDRGGIRLRRVLLAFTCIVGVLVVAGVSAVPEEKSTPKPNPNAGKVPDKVRHQPTPLPDRIILTWKHDPTNSQAVTWRTDTTVEKAVAEIAVAGENRDFARTATRIDAETTSLTSNLSQALYHSAEFTELKPKTKYAYRVGDGKNWSEWFHFRTASDSPEPFTFIYYGDAQTEIRDFWSRVIRESVLDAPNPRFLVHAGDLINSAESDGEWGDWFQAGGFLNGTVPSMPTTGNHEYGGKLTKHWRPQFALPEDGPPGLEETVYFMDYQGVRFVSLNSNEKQEEQVPWLEKVLADNPNQWTILTFHHPIYSPAKGRDNPKLRKLWRPIFDKYHVDLVLTGHDHTYARSGMMEEDDTVTTDEMEDGESGTVYVVSVSGPKMYSVADSDWMQSSAEQKQLYQVITIDGDKLHYEAHTATGELFDVFELRKKSEDHNMILERNQIDMPQERWRGYNRVQSWLASVVIGMLAVALVVVWRRKRKV